jgi:hypothetical protein
MRDRVPPARGTIFLARGMEARRAETRNPGTGFKGSARDSPTGEAGRADELQLDEVLAQTGPDLGVSSYEPLEPFRYLANSSAKMWNSMLPCKDRALPVHRAGGERMPSFPEHSADRANAEANLFNGRFELARRDFLPAMTVSAAA